MEPGKEMHFVTRGKGTNFPLCTEAMILFNFGSKNILKVWFFGGFFWWLSSWELKYWSVALHFSFLMVFHTLGICYSLLTAGHRHTDTVCTPQYLTDLDNWCFSDFLSIDRWTETMSGLLMWRLAAAFFYFFQQVIAHYKIFLKIK